jgi:oligopeptide/dipeptide ABC transporter ATP-binding protein
VLVLYAGRVAETAPAETLFATPSHPYTQALLSAIPRISGRIAALPAIPGAVPLPYAMPPGCRFAPRCAHAVAACATQPPMRHVAPGHQAACVRTP